jgi:hypothetical protein
VPVWFGPFDVTRKMSTYTGTRSLSVWRLSIRSACHDTRGGRASQRALASVVCGAGGFDPQSIDLQPAQG